MSPLETPIDFFLYKITNTVTGEVVDTGCGTDYYSTKEIQFTDPDHYVNGEPYRYYGELKHVDAPYEVETLYISAPYEIIAHALRSYVENPA